ncbi:glycerophosphodiester phosphodiesterase family protein [Paraurantiacibacter namhicola]|uniref:Cytoplasmic glycerophosphodiester phosphodiesterase n=1 Tax=Paraurantiacibacter namhicola TaxID=645517 RepID=A0A1C7D535_9SPHN|nr:glycerophosphodiester phosphodiesterase family protein [Paraurantiacibacter namhicola]ANU06578.1 cytoplasmic glycerophosphodiester phosphodiesterase [Paraurantiacibacter namhicola]
MPADWLFGTQFAHRGLHGPGVPENSLPAFAAAMERGMGIECDIQRSADDAAMVFHDWELERLTGEKGLTAARSAQELRQLSLLGTKAHPPTLSELLELVAGRTPLLIEIKSRQGYDVARSCQSVADCLRGYSGPAAVMSFDPRAPRWFARHAHRVLRGLVVTEEGARGFAGLVRRHLAWRHSRAQFLAYDVRDLPSSFAARKRSLGVPVLTWTVRSAETRETAHANADSPIAEGPGVV